MYNINHPLTYLNKQQYLTILYSLFREQKQTSIFESLQNKSFFHSTVTKCAVLCVGSFFNQKDLFLSLDLKFVRNICNQV